MLRVEIEKLKPHPLALELIPEMSDVEYLALLESIRKWGIKVPLDVVEGDDFYHVIDGVHRLRAAEELHLRKVPVRVLFLTEEQIADHIISVQAARRNLTPAQKAALAVEWIEQTGASVRDAVKRFGVSAGAIEVARSQRSNPAVFSLMRRGLVSLSEVHSARKVTEVKVVRESITESIGDLSERVEFLEEQKRILEEKVLEQKKMEQELESYRQQVRKLRKEKERLVSLVKKLYAISTSERREQKVVEGASSEPQRGDPVLDAARDAVSLLEDRRMTNLIDVLRAADQIPSDAAELLKRFLSRAEEIVSSVSSHLAMKSQSRENLVLVLKKGRDG